MTTNSTTGATEIPPRGSTARRRHALVISLVAVLAIIASSCSLAAIPGPSPLRYRDAFFTSVNKTADVTYGSAVDQSGTTVTLKMDIYQPAGDSNLLRPVIVFIHGGSFCCGNKGEADLIDQTDVFSKKGYVTASIDYRLASPGCTQVSAQCVQAILDATHDAQAAVRFFRRNAAAYRVDPTRIATDGTSAGAITSLLVGYKSDDPGTSGNPGYDSSVRAAVSLSGAAIFTDVINAGDAPALDFHGTADNLVPYTWAQSTADAAKAAGVEFNLDTWQGDGHVPYAKHRTEILDLTTNFLYHELDLGHAAQ